MRILAFLAGIPLALLPAFYGVLIFAELYPGASVVALALFYGWMLAGVIYQRRRGRLDGYSAFRGAMQAVTIAGIIGFFGPFVYAAVTRTTAGNLAPIWGVLTMIFGGIAAVGIGLIVYGMPTIRK